MYFKVYLAFSPAMFLSVISLSLCLSLSPCLTPLQRITTFCVRPLGVYIAGFHIHLEQLNIRGDT